VADVSKPEDLLQKVEVRSFLLTASGLSEKALSHLDTNDDEIVLTAFIDKCLKPAGHQFIEEAMYRYLLTKGDAVGGEMRNRIGAMAQDKLVRKFLSLFAVRNINYSYLDKNTKKWISGPNNQAGIESSIGGFRWTLPLKTMRQLTFNETNKMVGKNIDICLYDFGSFQKQLKKDQNDFAIMFGELKGGIDPAGADEHWKTGSTALERIRSAFKTQKQIDIQTCFIGGAIEKAMAEEIFSQLQSGTLSNAANLTNDYQFTELVNWMVNL